MCHCGHERRDHRLLRTGFGKYGDCKICLCARYVPEEKPSVDKTLPDSPQSNVRIIDRF